MLQEGDISPRGRGFLLHFVPQASLRAERESLSLVMFRKGDVSRAIATQANRRQSRRWDAG